ncbi:MAG: FAD-dependent oxidoreductase [Clostridia bacterium]|nr:FAD-dependent oxidoreductase [Clostridia bacterium]
MFDLAVIGAGATGLTAAIYAARAGINFIVLEKDGIGGGQIMSAHSVQNYPGFENISGIELSEKILNHSVSLGAEIRYFNVDSITNSGNYKIISSTHGETVTAKTVLIATGAKPKKLEIPGENEFSGKGVSYCATCDGSFYADKDIAVIGGGDTAIEDVIYLSNICSTVTLIHRSKVFRAAKSRTALVQELKNVKIILEAQIKEIIGKNKVTALKFLEKGVEKEIMVDGVFIAVGIQPVTDCLKNLPIKLENGFIVADENCKTNIPGIFAAGDIRTKPLRQFLSAASDGSNAVRSIQEYLINTKNETAPY